MTAHSHLGASGASRWMHCAGSVSLIKMLRELGMAIPDDEEEPGYRTEGSCAHAAACKCLQEDLDGWEVVGQEFEGMALTADMAVAIQYYLDVCRPKMQRSELTMLEASMAAPHLHPAMFGTTDCSTVSFEGSSGVMECWLDVVDYKNGAGISVDVVENPQEMYYARLVLDKLKRERPDLFDQIENVRLTIVQPNDYNPSGRVREWATTKTHILEWCEGTLLPAMRRAEVEQGLMVGDHCRFCPAKLVCPAQRRLFKAVADASLADVTEYSDQDLNADFVMVDAVMHHKRAIEGELLRRTMMGRRFDDAKLVNKQTDRVYKTGAADRFTAEFGDKAMAPTKLRSPAEMEKLGPEAKKLVKEWAFTPHMGYTIVPRSTKRIEVKPPSPSATFKAVMTKETE